jgi:hypothetical protein
MKNAQRPDHISFNTLIGWLKEGRFEVPDFQREFEWKPSDISALIRSIFQDYYIGSLLLWRGTPSNSKALCCESLFGVMNAGKADYIVLDGQQRLTAIHYAFFQTDLPLPGRSNAFFYYIDVDRFIADDHENAYAYDRLTKRWRDLLKDRPQQYESHVFPLSVIGSGGWNLHEWVKGYQEHWIRRASELEAVGEADKAKAAASYADGAMQFGDYVRELTEQYQISYIELDREIEVSKVCDIFTQINSRGVQLDIFDLLNALLKPKDIQLKLMWREASQRLSFVETEKMNVYVLQVMSILLQSYCSPNYLYYLLPGQPKTIRETSGSRQVVLIEDGSVFRNLWEDAVLDLEEAIRQLRQVQTYGVTASRFLPYVSMLPAFASIRALAKALPAERRLGAQRKLRKWYWASVFTSRYSGSVESTSARDFLDLKAWFDDDEAIPGAISDFEHRFRDIDFVNETKSGSSIYNGIFNLLAIKGAKDWISGEIPPAEKLDDHHIVPASWGREHLGGTRINTILNRAPLIAETNRHVISDRLPNEYLPELMANNGREHVLAIMESHLISAHAVDILMRPDFGPSDFDDFITERRTTILSAVEDLLIKERLDLPLNLRELDARIERIELALRKRVDEALGGDAAAIPQHVATKVEERIQKAMRRQASADEDFSQLSKKLEYFDLRELQDLIQAKTLWPLFDETFGSKEGMAVKFGQLAELRNGIRHSRSVGQIALKEGEAAALWFEGCLKARSAATA